MCEKDPPSEMRSTKLAVSLASYLVVGIAIGIFLGATWIWFSQNSASLQPGPQAALLHLWMVLALPIAIIVAFLGWVLGLRANKSANRLSRILPKWKESNGEISAITLPETDREYQRLVAELNELVRALNESHQRLERYSAKVAHELRAPITLLQLQLDFAAKKLDQQFVEAMRGQIRRLNEYVDTALFIAKVADNKIRPVKTRRKIAEVVQEVVEPYYLHAEVQGRKLAVKLTTDQEAELNEKLFGLILNNLISNALSHGSGEVRLRLRRSADSASLLILNRVRTDANSETGTGIGLRTIASLTRAHQGMKFRSRRVLNSYAAVVRITAATSVPIAAPAR